MVTSGRRRSRRREKLLVALAIAACDEPGADPLEDPQPATSITLPGDDACDDVRQWPKARREREAQMLEAIARVRNDGGTCPDARRFDAQTRPRPMAARLRGRNFCAYLEAST